MDLGVHLPLMQFADDALSFGRPPPDAPDVLLVPGPVREQGIPLWIGSWGYKTTPEGFSHARAVLSAALEERGRTTAAFPTMWTWVSKDRAEGDRVLSEVLAPLLKRDPDQLRTQVCVGPAGHCAELLSRYAEAGCQRIYLWPLGDEPRQLDLVAGEVAPQCTGVEL